MNKVIIKVYVPSINKSYDILVPIDSPLYEVIELIKKVIQDLSNGQFIGDEHTSLFNKSDGSILNINLSVYELDIKNGSQLILI